MLLVVNENYLKEPVFWPFLDSGIKGAIQPVVIVGLLFYVRCQLDTEYSGTLGTEPQYTDSTMERWVLIPNIQTLQ